MKFGRYLEETQIPEWKKAYIDYKGLKKRIAAVRKAKQPSKSQGIQPSLHQRPPKQKPGHGSARITATVRNKREEGSFEGVQEDQVELEETTESVANPQTSPQMNHSQRSQINLSPDPAPSHDHDGSDEPISTGSMPRFLTALARRGKIPQQSELTLNQVYSSLSSSESEFFKLLDQELQKVDKFYNQREDAVVDKLGNLKIQLRELSEHRRIAHHAMRRDPWKLSHIFGEIAGFTKAKVTHLVDEQLGHHVNDAIDKTNPLPTNDDAIIHDPAEYHHAKRSLKKALREFYRGLELLNDYRVLNLTGFRKALKKYEKVTKQQVQDLYMTEKINPRRFAFSSTMSDAMRDIENIYATRFENGNRKQARKRLKSAEYHKTHYFSTFRSGLFLGLGLVALVASFYNSFQPHIRQKISQWAPLLEIYFTLLVFVIFSLLLGINMLVWKQARINFLFIFELDVRTALDTQVYFELPSFLFATLSGAMFLSFFLIGSDHVGPTTWPLIWLIFAVIVLFNPLPIYSRTSRYWIIRHIFRLIIAGTTSVDFADFWLGDQFCSLAFGIAHLYTIGCAYSVKWQDVFTHCGSTTHWATYVLFSLPYLSRLVQSVRRYYDSRLPTHLINAGKYGSGIVMYAVYYNWRMGGSKYDGSFVVWCIFATLSSAYLAGWDILMDWSFFQRRNPYPLLRPELIYTNYTILYYFAIIMNIMIRFIWVLYIPQGYLNRRIIQPIVATLELLRRFQWNFFRLENEQIGNTDQYRATREVPLPYTGRYQTRDDDGESEDEENDIGGNAFKSEDPLAPFKLEELKRPRG